MQTEIYIKQALGINGVISKAESQYLATIQGVLMADTQIGYGVGFGEQQGELVNEDITADNFVGFVVRDGYVNSCETPTETYKQGDTVTVITKGSLFIKSEIALSQGDSVTIDATGKIVSGGAIETGWRVAIGCEANGVAEITTQLK